MEKFFVLSNGNSVVESHLKDVTHFVYHFNEYYTDFFNRYFLGNLSVKVQALNIFQSRFTLGLKVDGKFISVIHNVCLWTLKEFISLRNGVYILKIPIGFFDIIKGSEINIELNTSDGEVLFGGKYYFVSDISNLKNAFHFYKTYTAGLVGTYDFNFSDSVYFQSVYLDGVPLMGPKLDVFFKDYFNYIGLEFSKNPILGVLGSLVYKNYDNIPKLLSFKDKLNHHIEFVSVKNIYTYLTFSQTLDYYKTVIDDLLTYKGMEYEQYMISCFSSNIPCLEFVEALRERFLNSSLSVRSFGVKDYDFLKSFFLD